MANCYACKAEIVFDSEHIGKNGRKIPLDPFTKQPHDCPMREKKSFVKQERDEDEHWTEDKDDHGNEDVPSYQVKEAALFKNSEDKKEYVDHTAARPSKVKIFKGTVNEVETAYNEFLATPNRFAWTRAQLQFDNGVIVIALYYEETKQ